MKKILILDFETIGIEPTTCDVIEFAGILCNEDLQILETNSFLVNPQKPIPENTSEITGINDKLINEKSITSSVANNKIYRIVEEADILVAHNGFKFDFKILENQSIADISKKHLIDTMYHLDFSRFTTSKRLSHLCADKGIVFPDAHRAIADCLALLSLLRASNFDKVLAKSKEKMMQVVARVSRENKDKASSEGFRWNGSNWSKVVFESEFYELEAKMRAKDVSLQILNADLQVKDL